MSGLKEIYERVNASDFRYLENEDLEDLLRIVRAAVNIRPWIVEEPSVSGPPYPWARIEKMRREFDAAIKGE